MSDQLAPSLIITPHASEYTRRKVKGGGSPKVFGGTGGIEAARQVLLQSCDAIRTEIDQRHHHSPLRVGLAQVTLRDEALAKTHRPIEIFADDTCPVIGETDGLGKLLVVVTPDGLTKLSGRIQAPRSQDAAAHLTSVTSFTLLPKDYRLAPRVEAAIRHEVERAGGVRVKVRLPRFELFTPVYQADLEGTFHSLDGIHEKPYLALGNFLIYAADLRDVEQAYRIATLPFIDRIDIMPLYKPVRVQPPNAAMSSTAITLGLIPENLPTVVIADSGIDPASCLEPLVCGRDTFVAEETDPAHGTAVAALAAAQGGFSAGILDVRCRLRDIRIFASEHEEVQENVLAGRIEDAVSNYGEEGQTWVLACASTPGPRAATFSDLGQRLSELRQQYGLMFMCAAGNRLVPRTAFPPPADEDDWIGTPGDTVNNLTITSLAPENAPADAYALAHEPSPFAGRGRGPTGMPLPLVAEYGGNVTRPGVYVGIPTLGRGGCLRDMAGTSSTAPIVGGAFAELTECFKRSTVGRRDEGHDALLLGKAAMLHHAEIPSVFAPGVNLSDYFGFGVPPSLEELVGDPFWRSTTFISTTLAPNGDDLLIDYFPFPEGLWREDFCRGEVLVTLVTEPLLKSGEGIEYVRSHVDLKFGPAYDGADGYVGIEPNLVTLKASYPAPRYESEQIKEEQKWAPFRRYHTVLHGAGIQANRWALRAHLTLRAEESAALREAKEDKRHPQRFSQLADEYRVRAVLALTILDPQRSVQVSDQMVKQWQARGYIPTQIAVAQRIRQRFGQTG